MTMLPIRTALIWIWGSTIVLSGGVVLALSLKQKWNSEVRTNPKFAIHSIIQKCSSVESLSTDYLAECLGISTDRSYTLFEHSANYLTTVLESSPLIKSAKVSKILPSTLHIEYSLRQPVAILQDYQNTVIDDEGVLFPLQPFRTPKLLPEITLGDQSEQKMQLALELLSSFKNYPLPRPSLKSLARIDVSRAHTPQLSHREIILVFNSDSDKLVFLRLPSNAWRRALKQFFKLPHDQLPDKVIDMRLPNAAYVTTLKESKGDKR